MVGLKMKLVFCFSVFYIHIAYSDDIDIDYYFGSQSLRTVLKPRSCVDEVTEYRCHLKCGRNYVCMENICHCLIPGDDQEQKLHSHNSVYTQISSLDDHVNITPLVKYIKKTNHGDEHEYTLRPALRHHIAHFCPNLEVARQCIRKCMAVGKPAFCGKDHVCYCGHKTKNPMSGSKIDVEAMQKNFRDMYEKYFGIRGNDTLKNKAVTMNDSSSESSEHTGG